MDYLDYFDIVDGKLLFSGGNISELSEKYGTPLIIYSRRIIERNVRELMNAFDKENFSLHYAMKANYNPAILSILRNKGVGIDAANLNEVLLALQTGFSKDKIIASPNNLPGNELKNIKETGVTINFDDISQFNMVAADPPETVSFRINPGIGKGEFEGTTTGGKGSKFGMPPEAALKAYETAIESGVHRFGIHMMTGSNVLDPEFFRESTRTFFSIASGISHKLGITFEFVDIGGGFGVPYRDNEESLDLGRTSNYIKENMKNYRDLFTENTKLIIEPGRYIVANSAVLISRVTCKKDYDRIMIGTDTGMNILIRPALYGAIHPIIPVNKFFNKKEERGDVVGPICENTDKIAKDISIQKLEPGDLIAILNAGAYVTSMSSNYNLQPKAMEILLDNREEYIIRERDELQDMLNNFIIPEHLKAIGMDRL
ncbi:MAG: diaminopimelate decarboxylase [Thermoplasmata archaeon]